MLISQFLKRLKERDWSLDPKQRVHAVEEKPALPETNCLRAKHAPEKASGLNCLERILLKTTATKGEWIPRQRGCVGRI